MGQYRKKNDKFKRQNDDKQAKGRCLKCGKRIADDPTARALHDKAKHQVQEIKP